MTERRAELPSALAALTQVPFPYGDEGIDYEPLPVFMSEGETSEWLRAWTGNPSVSGEAFHVFGKDGTGGIAAIWSARDGQLLEQQPIVFLSSDGEFGVVASNLSDFLWLLADGTGPSEAARRPDWRGKPEPGLASIVEQHADPPRRSATEVLHAASTVSSDFETLIASLSE